MSLYSRFVELNALSLDIDTIITRYQITYLENDIEYPEEQINKLLDDYTILFNKAYDKKFSMFNEFLCKLSASRYYFMESLDALHPEEILENSSKKTLFYILQNYDRYIPYDKESQEKISNKLYPIISNIGDYYLKHFYDIMKENIIKTNCDGSEVCIAYLQDMVVDYIHRHVMMGIHDFDTSQHFWTTEEVCSCFLKEPLMPIPAKTKTRIKKNK